MLGRIKAASMVPPLAGVVDGEVLKSVEPQAAAGGVSSGGTGIAALPESVARTVRCGVLAPNIGAHLLQLMYNALDAKAANVAIKICLRSFTLQVRDDGEGMTFEDLRLCGERSFTSKLRHLSQLRETAFSTYGYRGESLAAISEFCHLEILSRSRARPAETCRKVMLSDEKATLARVLDSAGIGTTVTCRNLFFNRPVARKALQQRAGTFEASMAGQLQALLRLVRALAAIHPDVSFTVYDGTRIQPILALPKCAGVRQAFARISRAVSPNDLFHVGLSYGSYQIKALLCPPTQANLPRTKDAQVIYVNGRLCTRCPVHKRMNRAYKDVLERTTTSPDLSAATAAKGTERAGQVAFPQRKRRRGEDGPSILAPMKRCPVFLVRISCPPSDCAISEPLEPGEGASVEFASWDEVLVAVDALCAEFFSSLELRQDNILAVAGNGETARMLDEGRGGGLDQDVTVQARGKDAQAGGVFADCAAPLQHNMDCTGAIVAQVEEETLDSEEMRIIELAMQSATSAARLATTQGDLNPQLTCQVNDPMARGPRMALAACSTTSASSHGLQAHQDVPQRRWFNPEKQQWQLVSVSPSRQRSKLGGKRGVNSSATRFLAAAARKRERERGRERERNSAIELELAAQGRDRPSRVCGEACDGDQTQNFGDARNVISHQVHLEDNAGESGHAAEDAARGVAADCCSSCTPGASDALSRLLREGGKRDRRQENHYAPLVESLSSDRKMQEGDERDYLIAVTTGRNKGASATWQETEGLLDVHVEGRSARKGESEGNGCAKWDQVQEETFRGGDCDSDAGLKGLMNIGAMLEAWDNPVVGAYGCATSHRILRIEKFEGQFRSQLKVDREMLQKAQVVGQAFDKFIVVIAGDDVMLVDQHAADERVRIEAMEHLLLRRDAGALVDGGVSVNGGTVSLQNGRNGAEHWSLSSVTLSTSVELKNLSAQQLHVIARFEGYLSMWGFVLHPLLGAARVRTRATAGAASSFFAEENVRDEEGWTLVGVPEVMGTQLGVPEFMDTLDQLIDYGGARPAPPQAIRRVLVSKACRGAIMFGDRLSSRQCAALIASLGACSLPFQCAHGRPSLSPLLRLNGDEQSLSPPALPRPDWSRWRRVVRPALNK